ncbi:hypothetical protein MKA38_08785 [[Clostridium] innocuum]|nr:hypothetical protein [[Clostridium] innocuum]
MRRKKEKQTDELKRNMRLVCCSVCRQRIMGAVSGTKTQLIPPNQGWYPDFIVKCGHCGTEIGVIKTE